MSEKEMTKSFYDNDSIFPANGIKREKTEVLSSSESHLISWDQIKKDLVIGINSITKSLEKDSLLLVLVGARCQ